MSSKNIRKSLLTLYLIKHTPYIEIKLQKNPILILVNKNQFINMYKLATIIISSILREKWREIVPNLLRD